MTTYSKVELATHTYHKTGLIDANEDPNLSDLQFAYKVMESRLAYLSSVDVGVPNGSIESVPEEWLDPLADYFGLYLFSAFGGAFPAEQQVRAAMMPLVQLAASVSPATGSVADGAYF